MENCFIWDDKHGFGFNKDGEVVIVRPNKSPESPVFSSDNLNIACKFAVHKSSRLNILDMYKGLYSYSPICMCCVPMILILAVPKSARVNWFVACDPRK